MEPIRPKSNVLYIPDPLTTAAMHDLDVTVRFIEHLIHSNPHSSADLVKPLHFQELVKNLEIWNPSYLL